MDELLEQIAARHVEQEGELRVYADQLILRGDPLGELIVVASDRVLRDTPELARREAALIVEHDAALTRALGRPSPTAFRWRRGFLDTIQFQHTGDEHLEHALPLLAERREARLLRRIEIDSVELDGHGDLGPVFATLARLAPNFPRLTELVIREGLRAGSPWVDGPIALHDVSPIYAAYPTLEVLELDGDLADLHDIILPSARRFLATHLGLDDARRIVAAELPQIVELELAFVRRPVENVAAIFGPLLHRDFGAQLEALSIALPSPDAQAWMMVDLAATPIARRIRRLAFRRAPLDDACLRHLIAERPRYRHLERLELPDRALSASLQKHLRRAFGSALVLN